jgi:hypothetical protein
MSKLITKQYILSNQISIMGYRKISFIRVDTTLTAAKAMAAEGSIK